jgi:hypothetical protein
MVLQLGGLEWGSQPLTVKNKFVMKGYTNPRTWTDSLDERPKRKNMDMRFGKWNARSLYRAGTIMRVSRKLTRYRLDLMRAQEVRWEGSGTVPAGEYTFFTERGMRIMYWVQGFLYIRESYQQSRGLSLLMIGYHT